jgi:hypothetical protein
MAKAECPVCGQDWIHRALEELSGKEILICRECDSFWWPTEEIIGHLAKQFEPYFEQEFGSANPWKSVDAKSPVGLPNAIAI